MRDPWAPSKSDATGSKLTLKWNAKMEIPVDYGLVRKCLDEIEVQLLAVGKARCNSLHDKTQLSAVVVLLLRATSLLRSSLGLLERGESTRTIL